MVEKECGGCGMLILYGPFHPLIFIVFKHLILPLLMASNADRESMHLWLLDADSSSHVQI